jgi:hypothetical protein
MKSVLDRPRPDTVACAWSSRVISDTPSHEGVVE